MARRALLISSPRGGLEATGPSLVRMREFLATRGFDIDDAHCLHGDRATRAAIDAAFGALIDATGPGDAVVVYYAGHGGVFRDTVGRVVEPRPVIEPIDLLDSDADRFNGLLGGELRLRTRALARLCNNVTAIFDCCHAAGLVSADQPAAGTAEEAERAEIAAIARRGGERIAQMQQRPGLESLRSDHDPAHTGVVRLLASSATERAYADHARNILLFTDTLVSVLEEHALADGLTWEQIIRHVRARVQAVRPEQRPGVEGARDRRPFTTDAAPTPVDHVHVRRAGRRLHLDLGSAAGIRLHESFVLLPYARRDERTLGVARAIHVEPFAAELALDRGDADLPLVMFGRRVRRGASGLAAYLVSSDGRDELAAAARLTAASPVPLQAPVLGDTPPGHVDLVDALVVDGAREFVPQLVARFSLADAGHDDAFARAVRRLERWAGLAAWLGRADRRPLAGCYTLEWGREVDGQLVPPGPAEIVRAGESLAVRLYNPGVVSALHFQIFRVRADRCIDAWREAEGGLGVQTGQRLHVRETFTRLPGLSGRQGEWLVVALGDGAFDLAALATPRAERPFESITRSHERLPGEARYVEVLGFPYLLADAP